MINLLHCTFGCRQSDSVGMLAMLSATGVVGLAIVGIATSLTIAICPPAGIALSAIILGAGIVALLGSVFYVVSQQLKQNVDSSFIQESQESQVARLLLPMLRGQRAYDIDNEGEVRAVLQRFLEAQSCLPLEYAADQGHMDDLCCFAFYCVAESAFVAALKLEESEASQQEKMTYAQHLAHFKSSRDPSYEYRRQRKQSNKRRASDQPTFPGSSPMAPLGRNPECLWEPQSPHQRREGEDADSEYEKIIDERARRVSFVEQAERWVYMPAGSSMATEMSEIENPIPTDNKTCMSYRRIPKQWRNTVHFLDTQIKEVVSLICNCHTNAEGAFPEWQKESFLDEARNCEALLQGCLEDINTQLLTPRCDISPELRTFIEEEIVSSYPQEMRALIQKLEALLG